MIIQLDNESAVLDITSYVTVLTDTPDASNPILCQLIVYLGTGTDTLDTNGGTFKLILEYGTQPYESQEFSFTMRGSTSQMLVSETFSVPANTQVAAHVLSPNAADTAVGVDAYLYDVFPGPTKTELDTAESNIRGADSDDLKVLSDAQDTIDVVTTKLDDTVENDSGTYRFTQNALEQGPTETGNGANTFTYTMTDDAGDPIGQCYVWVTTDSAGNNIIASGYTDDQGEITFHLDAGTYYFWRKKSGLNFSDPDEETVT